MDTRVTVVIPTFERAALVERALASVYAQTRLPDEVLVVDDGSTDGTAELVEARYPGTIVLRQEENRGVSAARNRGIRSARHPWIALLDSDDEWQPHKLERQFEAIVSGRHLVCHTEERWIRDGRRVNPRRRHRKPSGRVYRDCLPLCAISPSAILLHRRVFESVGLFDESLPVCEDYDMWLRVAARYEVALVDEALVVKHGGHADQLSRSRPAMDSYRARALLRAWRELPLEPVDRRATLETLEEKLRILITGARKRNRRALLAELTPRLQHTRRLLELERCGA